MDFVSFVAAANDSCAMVVVVVVVVSAGAVSNKSKLAVDSLVGGLVVVVPLAGVSIVNTGVDSRLSPKSLGAVVVPPLVLVVIMALVVPLV